MADTHEEQLLSELLSSIARDDERLEAAHLESRVMATLDASPAPRFRPSMTHVVIAAAVVMAVLVPGIAWVVRDVPTAVGEVRVEPPQQTAVDTPVASATPYAHAQPTTRPALSRRTTRVTPTPAARTALSEPPITQSPITPIAQSPIPQSPPPRCVCALDADDRAGVEGIVPTRPRSDAARLARGSAIAARSPERACRS